MSRPETFGMILVHHYTTINSWAAAAVIAVAVVTHRRVKVTEMIFIVFFQKQL